MQCVINNSSLFYLVQQEGTFSFGLRPVADFGVFIMSKHENNRETDLDRNISVFLFLFSVVLFSLWHFHPNSSRFCD